MVTAPFTQLVLVYDVIITGIVPKIKRKLKKNLTEMWRRGNTTGKKEGMSMKEFTECCNRNCGRGDYKGEPKPTGGDDRWLRAQPQRQGIASAEEVFGGSAMGRKWSCT